MTEIYGVKVSDEQLERMAASEATVRASRAAARRRTLLSAEGVEGAVNCATCTWISDFRSEQRRGWCLLLRFMVSTSFLCTCGAYIRDN